MDVQGGISDGEAEISREGPGKYEPNVSRRQIRGKGHLGPQPSRQEAYSKHMGLSAKQQEWLGGVGRGHCDNSSI